MKIFGIDIRVGSARVPAKATAERAFAAAQMGRLTADWVMSPLSADAELSGSIGALRGRARTLENDNPFIEKFLCDVEVNVIGPAGMRLQMKIRERLPGGKSQLDTRGNECIETHWKKQGLPENYLVTGDLDEAAADRLIMRSIMRDGEILIRIVRGFAPSAYGVSFQLIEADHIDTSYTGIGDSGNRVRMGVEIDKWGRVVAVHVLTTHPGDYGVAVSQSVWRERIPASDIIHAFLKTRVGQNRGITKLKTIMLRTKMLDGYEEAELVAARTAAAKMGWIVTEAGESTPYTGDGKDDKGQIYMDAQPGVIGQLPVGKKFEGWDPQHPTAQYEAFRKGILRSVAAGLGVSYNKLASDLEGVTYSSLREGKLSENDAWMLIQEWYIAHVKRRMFSEWLKYALLAGRITDLDTGSALPFTKLEKFNQPRFRGRRWAWVDPLKDKQANKLAREEGWMSDADIIEEQGGDIEDVYAQIAEDEKLAKTAGVKVHVAKPTPAAPDVPPDDAPADNTGAKPKQGKAVE